MKQLLKKRIMPWLLSAALIAGMTGTPVYAVGTGTRAGGLCEHHPEHIADCGYSEGAPCTHGHTEDCYREVRRCVHEHTAECYPETDDVDDETTPANTKAASPTECTHRCDEESGCITKVLDCPHEKGEHDDSCGYSEGTPCTYVCEICANGDNTIGGDETESDKPESPVCTCEELCTEDSVNRDCPVCGAEDADLVDCEGTAAEEPEAPACICKTHCTEEAVNGDCPVCGTGGADLTDCKGAQPDNALMRMITGWEWIDEDGNLTDGELALPGVGADHQADFDAVVSMLPEKISANIKGADEPEEIALDGWDCKGFKQDENGNWPYMGSYVFTAVLPEGYETDPETEKMHVTVLLGEGRLFEGENEASVTINRVTTEYPTLVAAFEEANENTATVTMLKDVTLSLPRDVYIYTFTGGNITFDMNGKTLTNKADEAGLGIKITGGSLLVKGSGTISVDGCVIKVDGGTCTIQNGSFCNLNNNISIQCAETGKLQIEDGQFGGAVEGFGVENVNILGGEFNEVRIYNTQKSTKLWGGKIKKLNGKAAFSDLGWTAVKTALAPGYTFYDYEKGAWITDEEKLNEKVIENVEVKQIPVAITTQPKDITVYFGEVGKQISVAAKASDDTKEISYQWYRVGTEDASDEEVAEASSAAYTLPADRDVGTESYYCAVTCDGYTVNSNTVTVTTAQSGSEFQDGIKTYLGENPTDNFTYGDTITVKVTPQTTGAAPAVLSRARTFAAPAENQIAVFHGTNQLTDAKTVTSGTECSFAISTADAGLTPEDAGKEYTLTARYIGNGNMAGLDQDFKVTVKWLENEAAAELSGIEGTNGWYKSDVTLTAPDGFTVCGTPDGGYGPSIKITEEKAQTVAYYLKNDGGQVVERTAELSIDKTVPTISEVTESDKTDVSATVTVTAGDGDSGSGIGTYELTQTSGTGTPAITGGGSDGVFYISGMSPHTGYTFTAKVTDKAGNESGTKDITFTTEKESLSAAAVTLDKAGTDYNGSTQTPTVTVKLGGTELKPDTDYTVSYQQGDSTVTAPTDAGSYTVVITAASGGSYSGTVTAAQTFTINPRGLTVSAVTAQGRDYDPNSATVAIISVTLEGICEKDADTVSVDTNDLKGDVTETGSPDAGQYTAVTLTSDLSLIGVDSGNYTLTQPAGKVTVTGGVTITPKMLTPTVELDIPDGGYIYDGAAKTPGVIVKDGGTPIDAGEYEVSYSNNTEAGTDTAGVTITDKADGNYIITGTSGTFSIGKARQDTLTITGKPDGSIVYGRKFTLSAGGGSGNGAVAWTVTEGDGFATADTSTGEVNVIGVGNVTITATKAESSNYLAAMATCAFTAVRAEQTGFAITPVENKKYGEIPFTLATTGGNGGGAVTYSVSGDNGVLAISGATATILGAGRVTVTATKAASTNYNSATCALEITIGKADSLTVPCPMASSLTYGQNLSESSLTGAGTDYGSFSWTNGDTVPTVTNSGYEVKFTANADTMKNYETIANPTQDVPIVVAKAAPAVNVSAKVSGGTGSRQAVLTATVEKSGDGILPTGTVGFKNSTGGTDQDIAGAASVTITDGAASYTWTGLADQIYKVKAVYSGDSNYQSATSSETSVDTTKQSQENFAVSPIGAKTYGDGAFTLSTTGGSGTGAVTFESSDTSIIKIEGTTAAILKAGTVRITAAKAGDGSFNEAVAGTSVIVAKKNITVKAEDKTVVVGSPMPVFTYRAPDLVNGDTFTGPAMTTTVADTGTPGEYDIAINGGALTNADSYHITYVNGKLKVVERLLYAVTVTDGTADKTQAAEGDTVTVTASDRSGYTFTGWSSADVIFAGSTAKTTTFTMPAKAVSVTANYSQNSNVGSSTGGGSGSSGSSGGSSSGGSSSTSQQPAGTQNPTPPTQATTEVTPTVSGGTASATIPESTVKSAITAAQQTAAVNGTAANGISIEIKVDTNGDKAENLSVNLPKDTVDTLVTAGVTQTSIVSSTAAIIMDLNTLKEIQKQAGSDVNVTASKVDNGTLSTEAKAVVGSRPVYDLRITAANGTGITNFGNGMVSVSIPYILGANEKAGNVLAYYIDANGRTQELPNSVYNADSKTLSFVTNHFSMYAVGYKADQAEEFSDTINHWAKEDIDFVAVRGLLSGKVNDAAGGREAPLGDAGNNQFSPDTGMTRGMFVTALGRLAGIDPTNYTVNVFTDVDATKYYAPYTAWAAQKGIVSGTSATAFAPDQAVTRQEMAVIMANYAKATGYAVPKTHAEISFTDQSQIAVWAKEAVGFMQMAGVMNGRDGNRFDPAGTATRAEAAAVLNRYVKLVIDPATAQGWTKNADGHWLYYKDGKILTGWQTVDGMRYYFNGDGVMHEGWRQDTTTGQWYYWTHEQTAIGWKQIDGKWYYFNPDGTMAVNTKVDGYEIGPDGARL